MLDVAFLNSPSWQARAEFGIKIPQGVQVTSWKVIPNVGPQLEFVDTSRRTVDETMRDFWIANHPLSDQGVFLANDHFCSWRSDNEEWRLLYQKERDAYQFRIIYDE